MKGHMRSWRDAVAIVLEGGAGLVLLAAAVSLPSLATDTSCPGSSTYDGSGYYCSDPATSDMIPDISGTGTAISTWKPSGCTGDDCYKLVSAIGGTFTWYGASYSAVYISSNGYVSFGAGYTNDAGGASSPDSNNPNNAIYAYGDDLDPSSGGTVYYKATTCTIDRNGDTSNDACFVVQWNNVVGIDGGAALTVTVQLALDIASNEALVEIESEGGTDAAAHPHLIGTENSGGTVGLWYKNGGDVDSTAADATTHDQFIFSTRDTVAPAAVSKLTASAGDLTVSTEWTAPADSDLNGFLVLGQQGSAVTDSPSSGTTYSVGNLIGTATVICVNNSSTKTCTDSSVSNGNTYFYKAFAFDTSTNYSSGVATSAIPRAASTFKWEFTTANTSLAASGVYAGSFVASIGNDRLFHRVSASDGQRGNWSSPQIGGAVQSRPMIGDLNPGGAADNTAFFTSQDGYAYRFSLADGTSASEGSRNVAATGGDAGCTAGIMQAGPVVLLDYYDSNANNADDVVIVATRCAASNNKVLMYSHALNAAPIDSYSGDAGGLGICNGTPQALYRDSANNLVYVPVRHDGGESLVVLEVNSTPAFNSPAYAKLTGIGDIDASPELFAETSSDPLLVVGNTAGNLYLYLATVQDSGSLSARNTCLVNTCSTQDGAVRGVAASGRIPNTGLYEYWIVWSTDSRVHGIKVDTSGNFDSASYWSTAIGSPSKPLVLRYVNATNTTTAYVGSSDGKLYELNATSGVVTRSWSVEAGTTVGDPTFDYNDGTSQGIVVGTTGGKVHWVKIN